MNTNIERNIKNARLAAGLPAYVGGNNPSWQEGRINTAATAMKSATNSFIAKYGSIGTNVWRARLQGLDPDDLSDIQMLLSA